MHDLDEAKRQANLAKHGVDFAEAAQFDWDSAVTVRDVRRDYGEPRLHSTGLISGRLHILIWTPRAAGARIISLRRANPRERRRWAKENG
jgi:uncharacterized DUF497 family protein